MLDQKVLNEMYEDQLQFPEGWGSYSVPGRYGYGQILASSVSVVFMEKSHLTEQGFDIKSQASGKLTGCEE